MSEKSVAKTINNFIKFQHTQGNSESTIKLYVGVIKDFSEWLNLDGGCIDSLTRLDVQNYMNFLASRGLCASTIENKMAAITNLAKFLDNINIVQNIRKPEHRRTSNIAPKSLEKNEKNKVLREFERSKNLRNIALVYLFLYTGLRVSELVALNKQDITVSERKGLLKVKKGKRSVEREVPIPLEARLHLQEYLNQREDSLEELFLSNYKKRISIRSVQRVLQKYGTHPHQLRHTYCRTLVNAGIDISTVADLAGHTDINITRRYSKPTVSELENAVEKAFE